MKIDRHINMENLISWLLTFEDKAVLLEPLEVRNKIVGIVQRIQKNYEILSEKEVERNIQE